MKRILLVGDDPFTSQDLSRTLVGLGFGLDVAYDSRTSLFLADRRQYTHLVVDHDIDGKRGIQLFEHLLAMQRNAVGVLLSTAANLNTVVAAIDAGIRRVLPKPVDYAQLLPVLGGSALRISRNRRTMWTELEITDLSLHDIRECLTTEELIQIIRSVEYPFAGKERLEHFDRDTLERVVHLVCRWCRQRRTDPVADRVLTR